MEFYKNQTILFQSNKILISKDFNDQIILEIINKTFLLKFNLSEYFKKLKIRIKNTEKEALIKFQGKDCFKNKVICDMTSGLLTDSLILSKYAKKLITIEIDPNIYEIQKIIYKEILLKDYYYKRLADKLTILNNNSLNYIKNHNENIDIFYIDKMFENTKSALPKIDTQILRVLAQEKSISYLDFINNIKPHKKKIIIKTNNLIKEFDILICNFKKINNLYFYYFDFSN